MAVAGWESAGAIWGRGKQFVFAGKEGKLEERQASAALRLAGQRAGRQQRCKRWRSTARGARQRYARQALPLTHISTITPNGVETIKGYTGLVF